ncbi:hypothetical protein [Hydrogenophaga sp. NFH-34]|uniref:hypothetical protein n=1 Tax=Hydrogenophaga sp. NFH-34 TaxID=2744446 RepID=UPI001F1FB4B4|nr:hypothetical protein [Hydrogenophaga sp. NFH-34]
MRIQPGHAEVQGAIPDGVATVRAAGIFATNPARVQQYLYAGALFAAVRGWIRRYW